MPYGISKDKILTIDSALLEHVQKAFDNGYYIEAIGAMHAGLEFALNWHIRHYTWFKLLADKPITDYPIRFYDFRIATQILYDVGQLTKKEYDALVKLNKVRNMIVHYIYQQDIVKNRPVKITKILWALKGADETLRALVDRYFVDVIGVDVPDELKKKGRPYFRIPFKTKWDTPKSH